MASNVTSMGNGKIAVTLEDKAGISRIEYIDQNGERHVIQVPDNPSKITQELELPQGVTTIYVYDSFGDESEVSVGEQAIAKTVSKASVNGDGTQAAIDIESDVIITTITYVNENGEKNTVQVNSTQYKRIVDTEGAT